MKEVKRLFFMLILILPSILNSQISIDKQYEISLKAIEAIRQNDIDGFKELIDEDLFAETDSEVFNEFMNSSSDLLSKYDTLAPKELLVMGFSETFYKRKVIDLITLNFQFPPPRKQTMFSDQNLVFIFSEDINKDKIVGFKIIDYTISQKEREEDAKKIPHLSSLSLQKENIKAFRFWYDKGPVDNEFGNKDGVYALSGNKKTLKKANIDDLVSEILELINNAEIDSTDIHVKMRGPGYGKSEFFSLKMEFNDPKYKYLGEFRVTAIFTEEKGFEEINKDYLVIRHSRSHRYFIRLDKNELLKKVSSNWFQRIDVFS